MSEFSRKIYRAIGEYRSILRRNLSQAERMQKLEQLNLKVKLAKTSELEFYHIAQNIVNDARQSTKKNNVSYYSYHGTERFADHLESILRQYVVIYDRVMHTSQLASKAYLDSVQLLTLESSSLTEALAESLMQNSSVIAQYAEDHEIEHYYVALQQKASENQQHEQFIAKILRHYAHELQRHERMPPNSEISVAV